MTPIMILHCPHHYLEEEETYMRQIHQGLRKDTGKRKVGKKKYQSAYAHFTRKHKK